MNAEDVFSVLPGVRTVGAASTLNILGRRRSARISYALSVGFGYQSAICAIDPIVMGMRRGLHPQILLGLFASTVTRTVKLYVMMSARRSSWTEYLNFITSTAISHERYLFNPCEHNWKQLYPYILHIWLPLCEIIISCGVSLLGYFS